MTPQKTLSSSDDMNSGQQVPWEVSVSNVQQMRADGQEFLLLDVREPGEYATAKIDNTLLIPMQQLPARLEELSSWKEKPIVVHCHHGGRSMRVTQWLRQQGFTHVQNMAGGIDAWSQEIDKSVPRY